MLFNWKKICTLQQLPEEKIMQFDLEEKSLALLKKGEKIFAFSAACPHAGTPLCEGYVDVRGNIVCPQHHYRFDPANGRNTSGEGYRLKTYPVEIREGFIFVGIN